LQLAITWHYNGKLNLNPYLTYQNDAVALTIAVVHLRHDDKPFLVWQHHLFSIDV